MVSMMADFDDFEYLNEDQKLLLKEIAAQFSPEDSEADLGILFECTGFKAGTGHSEFWENYKDIEVDLKEESQHTKNSK